MYYCKIALNDFNDNEVWKSSKGEELWKAIYVTNAELMLCKELNVANRIQSATLHLKEFLQVPSKVWNISSPWGGTYFLRFNLSRVNLSVVLNFWDTMEANQNLEPERHMTSCLALFILTQANGSSSKPFKVLNLWDSKEDVHSFKPRKNKENYS